MSSRDSLDEILARLRRLAEPNGLITSDIEWAKEKLNQWALDIIGEDEDAIGSLQHPNDRRNQLRAEQKLRLKGDIDE